VSESPVKPSPLTDDQFSQYQHDPQLPLAVAFLAKTIDSTATELLGAVLVLLLQHQVGRAFDQGIRLAKPGAPERESVTVDGIVGLAADQAVVADVLVGLEVMQYLLVELRAPLVLTCTQDMRGYLYRQCVERCAGRRCIALHGVGEEEGVRESATKIAKDIAERAESSCRREERWMKKSWSFWQVKETATRASEAVNRGQGQFTTSSSN
jgi:hypothetical protein